MFTDSSKYKVIDGCLYEVECRVSTFDQNAAHLSRSFILIFQTAQIQMLPIIILTTYTVYCSLFNAFMLNSSNLETSGNLLCASLQPTKKSLKFCGVCSGNCSCFRHLEFVYMSVKTMTKSTNSN